MLWPLKYQIGETVGIPAMTTGDGTSGMGQIVEICITQEVIYHVKVWIDGVPMAFELFDFEIEKVPHMNIPEHEERL